MLIKSALRDWLYESYGMKSILLTGSLRSPPPIRAAPDFPLCRGQNKAPLCCELLMKGLLCGSLLSHRSAGGRWYRKAPKGECISSSGARLACFPTPAGRLYGFRRQRRHKKWRRRRRTSPAQRYYITPEGGSPQPAYKAKPITGRTLAAQGR